MNSKTLINFVARVLELSGHDRKHKGFKALVDNVISDGHEQMLWDFTVDPRNGFWLQWPTEFDVVTQPFGANPQNYAGFGLPGHEGIDLRAPTGSQIFACAPGHVYRVQETDVGPYGIHVRIEHSEGYKTVYAHLRQALVRKGEWVKRGQQIGEANNTGNSFGSHLHLTLKKERATEDGGTEYPSDIIDPTPYLRKP